jgi:hypothetical protein
MCKTRTKNIRQKHHPHQCVFPEEHVPWGLRPRTLLTRNTACGSVAPIPRLACTTAPLTPEATVFRLNMTTAKGKLSDGENNAVSPRPQAQYMPLSSN